MHTPAEQWKAKCLACGETVTFERDAAHPDGNWDCKKLPGHHKVQEKIYFHLGGGHLQNLRERRGWSPTVILRAGYAITDPKTGAQMMQPTIRVTFPGQQLATEDPEIQFLVEKKNDKSIAWGNEGRREWQRVYLSQEQQKDLANAELESINKQIRDSNALLADVQGRAKAKQPAAS